MSLYWYTCISTNTYCFETHHILLKTNWWALSNTSSIVQICPAIHEILADKAFTATDILISQSFVVAFVYPIYVQIALIWGFLVQLICENWFTGCGDTSWMNFVTYWPLIILLPTSTLLTLLPQLWNNWVLI